MRKVDDDLVVNDPITMRSGSRCLILSSQTIGCRLPPRFSDPWLHVKTAPGIGRGRFFTRNFRDKACAVLINKTEKSAGRSRRSRGG